MNATLTKQKKTFEALKDDFGYTSTMQAPKITKIVVSSGVSNKIDAKKREVILGRLSKITGQAAAPRSAKKSIANFKTRTGDVIGYQITLRGERMESFLSKLINIVLPRVKDFRGLSAKAIDEMGNMTIGIKEHTVFPETADEDARDVFGLAITITTTAKNKQEAERFLRHIGIPFRA